MLHPIHLDRLRYPMGSSGWPGHGLQTPAYVIFTTQNFGFFPQWEDIHQLQFSIWVSQFLFSVWKISSLLQWIVSNETGCYWISHFLDDFPLLECMCMSLREFMDAFYFIMQDICMPVVKCITLGLAQILEYLGLILNFILQTIQIPEKKRVKCLALIDNLLSAKGKKVMVKMIQQTAGSLNFICQAIPAGRPFLQSPYRLTWNNNGGRVKEVIIAN